MSPETLLWAALSVVLFSIGLPLVLLAYHVERLRHRVANLEEHLLARRRHSWH